MHPMIDELLNLWEESLERGEPLSPEQLCEEHPELLEELRWQIHAIQAVDARFGAWSPSHEGAQRTDSIASRLDQTIQISTTFQIDRLHATGGLGEVYLARDPQLQRTVAIKYPRAHRLNSEQLARFAREAQVTGQLNHPGIVPVIALKQDSHGQPCYVMRFIDGPTLQDRIEQLYSQPQSTNSDFASSLEVRQLLQNFVSLCNIAAYAHEHGIIHRDIKPSNVILGMFGETMLMDWGLAKIMNEPEASGPQAVAPAESVDTVVERSLQTRTGQFMGTPAFASPEQRQGRLDILDARADVYSLGATLFAILTGAVPNVDNVRSVPLRNRTGGLVPRRLFAICQKAMAEETDQRYLSAVKLREDIDRYLAGEPISVVKETVWSRLSRTVRRKSGWAAALLVGVSVAILAGGIGSVLLNQKNQLLRSSNEQLKTANAQSLASQQRSAATTDLLAQSLRAATPEVAQGKEPTVRQLLDETSKRVRTDKSLNPLVAADTHHVLAEAYESLSAYETAREHAELASEMYQKHSGESSADALVAQATHARNLSRLDHDEEAIRIARDALQRGRSVDGLDLDTMLTLIDVYASVCSYAPSPNHAEIVALHREAYDLANEKLGPEHHETLLMSSNLATAIMDSGNLAEAEPLLVAIHHAHEERLGKAHPETLVDAFNLIALLVNKHDLKAAEELVLAQRPLFEEVFGLDHLRTIRLGLVLVQVEFGLGNVAAAEQEARLTLERAVRGFGPVHERTLEARGMLTGALVALGRVEEAEEMATEQYSLALKEFGDSHPATIQSITLLFDVAELKGDIESMSKWLEKLKGSRWESGAAEALRGAREKKAKE